MKKFLTVLLSALLVAASLPLSAFAQTEAEEKPAITGDYVQGEVIVCLETGSANQRSRSALPELLAGAETLMSLSDSAENTNSSLLRSRSAVSEDTQVLALVKDESRSTEALIAELESYPQVVFAEPNYITTNFETTATETYPDLSDMQWANSDQSSGDNPFENQKGFNIGVPDWNVPGASAESDNPVVAILDTGVDLTNPDLKDKLWTRPAGLGLPGGDHGINVSGKGSLETVVDTDGHGTHCAGIVGAAWNDMGVSGAGEKIEIMAIQSNIDIASKIQGFDYVKQACQKGVNVKAVNLSWGGPGQSKALDRAIEETGKAGAIALVASGNSGWDNDISNSMASGFLNNPYAVVVNSANPTGTMSTFSDYGKRTTDIVAPGSQILSTVPMDQSVYYPEKDKAPVWYDNFEDGQDPAISFFYDAACTEAAEVTKISGDKAYEGSKSLSIDIEDAESGNVVLYSQPMDLSEKASAIENKAISIKVAAAGQEVGACALLVKNTGGEFEEVKISGGTALDGTWMNYNAVLPEDTNYKSFQMKVLFAFRDVVFLPDSSNPSVTPNSGTVYADAMGIGDASKMLPFDYKNGTSMATPAAAGAAALLGSQYNESGAALAARVVGSVTQYSNFTDKCVSGGMVNVSQTKPYPVLNSIVDQGDTIEVDGYFFENLKSATIGGMDAEIVTNAPEAVSATDGGKVVTLKKPEGFAGGTAEVSLTTDNGEGHQTFEIGQNVNIDYFEENLPLPEDEDFYKAENKQIVGYQNQLYVLPDGLESEPSPEIWAYSIEDQKWSTLELPEALVNLTGATWNGRLAVAGLTVDEKNQPVEKLWFYDGQWQEQKVEGLPFATSLVNADGTLMGVGGQYIEIDKETNQAAAAATKDIVAIDTKAGTVSKAGELAEARAYGKVSVHENRLIISGGTDSTGAPAGNIELVTQSENGYQGTTLSLDIKEGQAFNSIANATVKNGFMLAGPQSASEDPAAVADAYTVDPQTGGITPYGKRIDDGILIGTGATAYHDQLYVLAASYTAPGGYIFKATAVETINPQPGEEADKKPDDNSGQTVNPENKPDNVKTGIIEDSQTAAFLCAGMLILALAGLAAYRKRKIS
ncbi:S8 family serine peptidase [Eubacterium limosum]|uniref:S8 family serine peptidase n=1 Tax=Eubacterium limosum TaxID=1736 RepID=UPI00106324FE|nr:S8 family serine peptidase [Eubacterium limosum]